MPTSSQPEPKKPSPTLTAETSSATEPQAEPTNLPGTGILIDPWLRQVTEVPLDAFDLEEVYQVLSHGDQHKVTLIESFPLLTGNVLLLDEEGKLKDGLPIWHLAGYPGQHFVGKGLIVGIDIELGEWTTPALLPRRVQNAVRFTPEKTRTS